MNGREVCNCPEYGGQQHHNTGCIVGGWRPTQTVESGYRPQAWVPAERVDREINAALDALAAEVEGLDAKPSGAVVTGTCYQHEQWGCVTCRPAQWVPDGDATLSRAAVLALIAEARR